MQGHHQEKLALLQKLIPQLRGMQVDHQLNSHTQQRCRDSNGVSGYVVVRHAQHIVRLLHKLATSPRSESDTALKLQPNQVQSPALRWDLFPSAYVSPSSKHHHGNTRTMDIYLHFLVEDRDLSAKRLLHHLTGLHGRILNPGNGSLYF